MLTVVLTVSDVVGQDAAKGASKSDCLVSSGPRTTYILFSLPGRTCARFRRLLPASVTHKWETVRL